jgi:hypothetical protein
MEVAGGKMTQSTPLFQHSCNAAWLVLATHESLQPPFLFDLSLEMAALIDEAEPVLIVQASSQDDQSLAPFLDQLSDTIGPDRIDTLDLSSVELKLRHGGIGALVLQGGSPPDWVESASKLEWKVSSPDSPFIDLVLLVGAPCAAVGEWMLSAPSPDTIGPGLGWLPQGIVTPGLGHPADLEPVRDLLAEASRSYAIGLPPGGILAFGPSGELEIWSEIKPSILLGTGWGQT